MTRPFSSPITRSCLPPPTDTEYTMRIPSSVSQNVCPPVVKPGGEMALPSSYTRCVPCLASPPIHDSLPFGLNTGRVASSVVESIQKW